MRPPPREEGRIISRETVLTSEPKLTVEICSLTLLSCSSYHLSVTFPCHKPHFRRISLRLLIVNSVSFTLFIYFIYYEIVHKVQTKIKTKGRKTRANPYAMMSISSTTFSHRLTNGIAYQWPISCSIVYLLNPSIPCSFVNEMAVIDYSVINIILYTRKATNPTNRLPIKQQEKN